MKKQKYSMYILKKQEYEKKEIRIDNYSAILPHSYQNHPFFGFCSVCTSTAASVPLLGLIIPLDIQAAHSEVVSQH